MVSEEAPPNAGAQQDSIVADDQTEDVDEVLSAASSTC